jgi:hypothetical protein
MGCHLFNRYELSAAFRSNLVDRSPLAAESYGPLSSSVPPQGFVVEAGHTLGRFQPILLDGFDPRHQLVYNVHGSPPKLPARSIGDDNLRDHDGR